MTEILMTADRRLFFGRRHSFWTNRCRNNCSLTSPISSPHLVISRSSLGSVLHHAGTVGGLVFLMWAACQSRTWALINWLFGSGSAGLGLLHGQEMSNKTPSCPVWSSSVVIESCSRNRPLRWFLFSQTHGSPASVCHRSFS